MASLGDLVVHLKANSSQFNSGLKKAESGLSKFSKQIKGLAVAAAGVVSLRAVTGAIAAAREQIQQEQKLQAVLKATGGAAGISAKEIQAYAAELEKLTNFTEGTTVNAAALLATFKEVKDDAFKETLAVALDMTAVIGNDLKGNIIQLGKAMNDPTKGLAALSDAGVSFTEQQKEQIRTLQKSGDILGAQKIIMKELASEFGGAAAAMRDPLTQLWNQIVKIGAAIGAIALNIVDLFVPALKKILSIIDAVVTPVLERMEWAKEIAKKTAELSDDGGNLASAKQVEAEKVDPTLAGGVGAIAQPEFNDSVYQSMLKERRDLAVMRGELTELNRRGMDFRDQGASHREVEEMKKLWKEKKAIEDQEEKIAKAKLEAKKAAKEELKLAKENKKMAAGFRKTLDDKRTQLKVQLGLMSEIDAKVAQQAKAGMSEAGQKEYRALLEAEQSASKAADAKVSFSGVAERGSVEAFKMIANAGKRNALEKIAEAQRKALLKIVKNTERTPESQLVVQGAVG